MRNHATRATRDLPTTIYRAFSGCNSDEESVGYVLIARSELSRLGILGEISHDSRQSGQSVYVDDGEDLALVRGVKSDRGEGMTIIEKRGRMSLISSLDGFDGGEV